MNTLPRNIAIFAIALVSIFCAIGEGNDAKRLKRFEGGENAVAFQHNWVVSIRFKSRSVGRTPFGGSLIHKRFVLTAAARLENVQPFEIEVRSGSKLWENGTHTVSDVSRIVSHSEFEKKIREKEHHKNNIAIIELAEDLFLGAGRIITVGLPTTQVLRGIAQFSGWGEKKRTNYERKHPRILQIANMSIANNSDCLHHNRPDVICAHHHGGTITRMDFGHGLVVSLDDGTFQIIGISGSSDYAIGGHNTFTNVYHFLDWITNIIGVAP